MFSNDDVLLLCKYLSFIKLQPTLSISLYLIYDYVNSVFPKKDVDRQFINNLITS